MKNKPSQELPGLIAERKREYERRLSIVQSVPEKVCNASSKAIYKTPHWPSARVSQADSVPSRGWA